MRTWHCGVAQVTNLKIGCLEKASMNKLGMGVICFSFLLSQQYSRGLWTSPRKTKKIHWLFKISLQGHDGSSWSWEGAEKGCMSRTIKVNGCSGPHEKDAKEALWKKWLLFTPKEVEEERQKNKKSECLKPKQRCNNNEDAGVGGIGQGVH